MVSKQHVLLFRMARKQNCSCNKLLDDEKLYPVIEAGATSYLLKHQEQVILLMLYELLMMEKQY